MTDTPEWLAWHHMLSRCKSEEKAEYYKSRGISVCERWSTSFECFLADMGPMPSDKRTIDRIDNDKGYSPDNCRWASTLEQNRNKRSNKVLTFNGETMTTAEWARRIGLSHTGLSDRLNDGWTVEEALTRPPMRRRAS